MPLCRGGVPLDWLLRTQYSDLIQAPEIFCIRYMLLGVMDTVWDVGVFSKAGQVDDCYPHPTSSPSFLISHTLLTLSFLLKSQSPLQLPSLQMLKSQTGLPRIRPSFFCPGVMGVSKFKARLPAPSCWPSTSAGAAWLLSNISRSQYVPVMWLWLLGKQVLWHPMLKQGLGSGVLSEA